MGYEDAFPILAKFNRVNWTSSTQGDCQCSAHPDEKNSLHIAVEGNALLRTCLAGCDTASILMATDSLFSDL